MKTPEQFLEELKEHLRSQIFGDVPQDHNNLIENVKERERFKFISLIIEKIEQFQAEQKQVSDENRQV